MNGWVEKLLMGGAVEKLQAEGDLGLADDDR